MFTKFEKQYLIIRDKSDNSLSIAFEISEIARITGKSRVTIYKWVQNLPYTGQRFDLLIPKYAQKMSKRGKFRRKRG